MIDRAYLDRLTARFEHPAFIDDDPIAVCHSFDDPRDQEVIGLYAAILAWGRRSLILTKLSELCERMAYEPWAFVVNYDEGRDGDRIETFGHRTFLPADTLTFTQRLSHLLNVYGSVENIFGIAPTDAHVGPAIERFSRRMMNGEVPRRLSKHLARPSRGSACKRLCLYLRWMVRPGPVDLGIWSSARPDQLILPLDVHSGRQARALGVLNRKANDWVAALELTRACQTLNARDPARYDFAFFGLGVYGDS